MVTLFSVPRAFSGAAGRRQINALKSWSAPGREHQIILLGNEPGTAEAALRFGALHLPLVRLNRFGTPLLDSSFDLARESAAFPILCYVNSDVILVTDITPFATCVNREDFLLVGRRTNVPPEVEMDMTCADWEQALRRQARLHGALYSPNGIDYFIFPRDGQLGHLPPFAVGRPSWDNWFIRDARERRVPVVDITRQVLAIHENHDYGHVVHSRDGSWEGPEADENRALHGPGPYYDIRDATHVMAFGRLYPAILRRYVFRLPRVIYERRHGFRRRVRLRSRARTLGANLRDRLG